MYGRILLDGVAVNTRPLNHWTVEALEALWADLSQTPANVPVPQWHRDVLKARQESPATWLDWEQAKASLRDMVNKENDSSHDHRDP
jgi:hypothetical protein